MGLPIAAVQVGIADRIATMEHPAVAHIDAHMRNARRVIGADKEHQITGPGAARPGADVINYNVQPDKVNKLFQEVGMDYVSTILTPVVEGTIKDIIGKWNAQDLIANREKATGDILFRLQNQLSDNYINVTDFQMTEINYSDVFERAIESKVTAEQEALKAKNKTVQVQEEAKQKVIAAEAEAKSMAIRAKALSQNKSLVQYEAVQKWDGKMPQYMLGGSMPFINVTPSK